MCSQNYQNMHAYMNTAGKFANQGAGHQTIKSSCVERTRYNNAMQHDRQINYLIHQIYLLYGAMLLLCAIIQHDALKLIIIYLH